MQRTFSGEMGSGPFRIEPGKMKQVVPMIEQRMLQTNNGRNIDMKTVDEISAR